MAKRKEQGLGDVAKPVDPLEALKADLSKSDKQSTQSKQGLPNKPKPTVQQGLPDGWTRATYIVREEHQEKIKALAYWERKQIKEVLDEAIAAHLKGRRVKPIPKK